MKKFLLFASAFAGLFLAASCQQETLETYGEGIVTFSVTAPGELDTRAIADGVNVDEVHYAVYKTDSGVANSLDNPDETPLAQGYVPMSNKKATLELDLLQDQNYTILFWAQVAGKGHYVLGDLREVKVASATVNANDESRAAFFRRYDFNTTTKQNYEVELYRPFAQINLGTTLASLNPVQQGQQQGYSIDVQESEMVVKGIASSFSLVTGEGKDEEVDFTFSSQPTPAKSSEKLVVNDIEYHYVAMNYLLIPVLDKNVTVSYKITTDKGVVENTINNVPVKENYRTNIIGNLLTSKTEFEIIVDEKFNEPDIPVVSDGWALVSGYDYVVNGDAGETALAEILAHADAAAAATRAADGPVVTIELNGDVYWATEGGHGSSPLLPATSKISKVVINGNGNTFTATGAGVGSIRLANGGLLEFNKVNIIDESKSYAEDSWEFTYLEFAGNLAFNECTFNSGATFQTEDNDVTLAASFDDCRFITNEDSVYAVWVSDGATSFTGCTFEGTRGLKMHEAYGSEVKSVTIDGCWFGPLSKKPGIAIGTVNADTKVTVKNSKFSGCQVGEQGITTYETDTDTSTFEFVFENNEVFGTPSEMLKDALDKAAAGATVEVPAGEYTFPAGSIKEGMTLKCAEGTVFEGSANLNIKGATVEGATFSNDNGSVAGSTINGTFKDCEFTGKNVFRYCYAGENVVFENCNFKELGDEWLFHFDGGSGTIVCRNCTFDGKRVAIGGAISNLEMENCTFINGSYFNTYCNSTITNCALDTRVTPLGGTVNYNNCTKDGVALTIDKVKLYNGYDCTINIDDVTYTWKENALSSETGDYYASTASMLTAALKAKAADIILMPGTYEGTFRPAAAATIKSASATDKAVIKGRVNIDNYADGIRFENIKFEINDDSTVKYPFEGTNYQYPAIVMIYAAATTFEGCEFTDLFNTHNTVAINYGAHADGKMLTINDCYFQGYAYAIRSRALVSVTNSTFDHTHSSADPRAVWVWGLTPYNSTSTTEGQIIFKGNKATDKAMYALQMTATSFDYDNLSIDVQNNENFVADPIMVNTTKCNYDNITFATGSATFEY